MKESKLYIIVRPLIKLFVKVFHRPKYVGLDNIPASGRIILAGTHTHNHDCILLISSIKRPIHFLAKKELFKFPAGLIMKHMGLIPVDRSRKSPESLIEAKKYLDDNKVVLIFPEGTLEKEKGVMLQFKMGAVKLAYDTKTNIIPFAISGNYFGKDLTIKFGEPFKVKGNDLDKELERLKDTIEELRK